MSNRLDNTRVVTFKEDYSGNGKKVIYPKGHETAIHKDLVERLEKKGAKMTVKEFDQKKKIAEAKEAVEKAEKEGGAK